ncbi:MAG: hypothetical protein M1400_02620 [Patescibacteria group bacterium]|nr:hypothetical protein [Patescibacteria group bacterium]
MANKKTRLCRVLCYERPASDAFKNYSRKLAELGCKSPEAKTEKWLKFSQNALAALILPKANKNIFALKRAATFLNRITATEITPMAVTK